MSYQTEESLGGGLIAFVVTAVLFIVIATTATDTKGVQPWAHREAIPAAVVQLAPDAYIAPGTTIPESICKSGVYRVRPVQALDKSFIQCTSDEVWNAKGPGSPNFVNAFVHNATHLWFYLVLAAIAFVCFIHGIVLLVGDMRDARRTRKLERERLPKVRQALLDEYAQRDWSDDPALESQYLDKIARLSL
jgi:hypothetical protein